MGTLNPAKAPLHGSGDTAPGRLSAGAQPPPVAHSAPAWDGRVPHAPRDLETGLRPHSHLHRTLGSAPQWERRTGLVSWAFPLARCSPYTQHLPPSRPLRKPNKSSANVKAVSCSAGRTASHPSQRPWWPAANTPRKELPWGTAARRSGVERGLAIVPCHRPRPPATRPIPGLTQDAASLQAPPPQEAWPSWRPTDAGAKRGAGDQPGSVTKSTRFSTFPVTKEIEKAPLTGS